MKGCQAGTIVYLCASLLGLSSFSPVFSQERTYSPDIGLTIGLQRFFLDEPFQPALGARVRVPLVGRIGAEPEFFYSSGSRFRDWALVPNLTFDLGDRRKAVTPYLIGGVGILNCRDKLYEKEFPSIKYSAFHPTWQAGFGVKLPLNKSWFVSPEISFGRHEFPRITIKLGYVLSRSKRTKVTSLQ